MLAKIVGAIWIILGLFWLIKPGSLRDRFKRKMSRTLRRIVFCFVIVFAFSILASVIKTPGTLSKVIAIIAIVMIIKGIMLITSRSSDKFFEWLAGKPLIIFRIWALIVLGMGLGAVYIGF